MSGWYIDPKTGEKITLKPGETMAGTGLIGGNPVPIASGSGYLHTSFWDKLFSWAGKASSYLAGRGAGEVPGLAPIEWAPKISPNRPPEIIPQFIELPGIAPGVDSGGVGEAIPDPAAASASGLMPWAIGVAAVVFLFWLGRKT